ncbi:MAG: 3-deoxy-7-phosphoheptulonate synthase [Flavobacteriales bacterium]|jgi:3-deoxy-7-phosphoheptulonate synthase|nr:3-deoxy-7-phosphoheptulonate synthase [Flavobacteriales bacterium]NCG30521.1 3-deoxy-7-phosphoheptulonate synthase [Bacteroidota bacterium]MBT3963338.1 3-deoxy-7-phosphoheptulonate synthase [Flavobacteriales bacterium]MBT4705553.1 3-deoxy-7-phosphoheptulonate synthase [Flavobacteriales bacterium]MBT4931092.1 3-deoxy-7-phosphoheptulonate synthase [Flavobacteriales bacterium]
MIIHTKDSTSGQRVEEITKALKAISFEQEGSHVVVTSSSLKEVPSQYADDIEDYWVMDTDIQLASNKYRGERREVRLGKLKIGGATSNTMVIAGPCSVESEEQIEQSASFMNSLDVHGFRGGAFKPRTSPYSFQGMGVDGLKLLGKMREKYGFVIFSEVRDATHVDDVIEHADVIQIGAKSMYDHGILRACAKTTKPVMIKRGFGTTLQEFVQAAEFILSGGNPNVILCERGIRTFETKTRFTLDLCGVAWLKENTNLPIILDPSHALGYRYGISDLSKACMAMGIDGLLIEVHPNPAVAKSDASQQLHHEQFEQLLRELEPVANAVNRNLV